jgi:hypothetical protein
MWLPAILILVGVLCLGLLALSGIEVIFTNTLGMLDLVPDLKPERPLSAPAYTASGISSAEQSSSGDYAGASNRHEVDSHARQRIDCR